MKGCTDPWGVILADGTAAMVMLGDTGDANNHLFLFRSQDGGKTWPDQAKFEQVATIAG